MAMALSIEEFWKDNEFKGWNKKQVVEEAKKDVATLSSELNKRQGKIHRYEEKIKEVLTHSFLAEHSEEAKDITDILNKVLKTNQL